MSDKTDLIKARADMLAILDEKLKDMPEWRAFRVMERAIAAMQGGNSATHAKNESAPRPRGRPRSSSTSYSDLALKAIDAAGKPVPTPDIVAFVAQHKTLKGDPKKTRINIQSGLSRDPRIESVPWQGGRAWWHTERPVPKIERTGTSANS